MHRRPIYAFGTSWAISQALGGSDITEETLRANNDTEPEIQVRGHPAGARISLQRYTDLDWGDRAYGHPAIVSDMIAQVCGYNSDGRMQI